MPRCDTTCSVPPTDPNGPTPTPPVVVRPSTDLPASLTASMDSLVHLVFTVKNPSGAPIRISFPSSQRFDIVAIDSTTGRNVWTWSANQTFLAMVQDETVPGNGALVYTASWKPPAKAPLSVPRDAREHVDASGSVHDRRRALILR